jgi:hypothetical protein
MNAKLAIQRSAGRDAPGQAAKLLAGRRAEPTVDAERVMNAKLAI